MRHFDKKRRCFYLLWLRGVICLSSSFPPLRAPCCRGRFCLVRGDLAPVPLASVDLFARRLEQVLLRLRLGLGLSRRLLLCQLLPLRLLCTFPSNSTFSKSPSSLSSARAFSGVFGISSTSSIEASSEPFSVPPPEPDSLEGGEELLAL